MSPLADFGAVLLDTNRREIALYPSSWDMPQYNNPGLEANKILRILFAFIGTLLLWVPFRLLVRNREFAAVVLILNVVSSNVFTVTNSLLWPDDNWDKWWDGYGLCDIQVYLVVPRNTNYAACILVIMRNLANRLRLRRVADLTEREKKHQFLVEALILFALPVVQIAAYWLVQGQRYLIGTLIGCLAVFDGSYLQLILYNLPLLVLSVSTIPYAYLTWKRFREISKTTKTILASNKIANYRTQRTRRRLYQMALSIVVPYVPVQVILFILSTKGAVYYPYSYQAAHSGTEQYPWNSIFFIPSWMMEFPVMNQPWIPIFTTIPIVIFFGMTTEAIDTYRKFLLRLGFGTCFKALEEPYDPDKAHRNADMTGRALFASSRAKANHTDEALTNNDNLPCASRTSRPDNLPNVHHQAIISSTGPFIPPRHSSSFSRPAIPPRSSSVQQQRDQPIHTSPLKHIRIPIKIPSLNSLKSLRKGSKEKPPRDDISSTMSTSSQPSGSGGLTTYHHDPPSGLPERLHQTVPTTTLSASLGASSEPQVSSSGSGQFSFPSPRSNVARWNPRDGLEWSLADIHRAREGQITARWWPSQDGGLACDGDEDDDRAGQGANSSGWQTETSGSTPEQSAGFQRFQIPRRAQEQPSLEDESADDASEGSGSVIRRIL